MMAPPLAGSPRVQAHRDYVIKVLLKGLTGPLDGKTYPEVMVPMGGSTDEWVAGIASYVRTSFGNSGGLVTPADVARVRAETASRKAPWTIAGARGVAAAAARLAAIEAVGEPRTGAARPARDAPRLEFRCAAEPGGCGSASNCRSRRRHRNAVRFGEQNRGGRGRGGGWRPPGAGARRRRHAAATSARDSSAGTASST